MSVRMLSMLVFVLSLAATAVAGAIDVGKVDQKEPPSGKEMAEPASDQGIESVGVYGVVTGQVAGKSTGNVYLLVNPLSNPETRNVWWVQQEVSRNGGKFRAQVQFGEHSQGAGEFFGILALETDQDYRVGEEVRGLPPKMTYTKLKVVKRKP